MVKTVFLSGANMSLRMHPGFMALADVELTKKNYSDSISSLGTSTSFCSNKEVSEISLVRISYR